MVVLIVGLGSIALKHINALRSVDNFIKIIALRSTPNSQNNVEGIENIYSLTDLQVKPAFAIIANPTILHFDTISQLAVLEVPLFIEKPPLHSLKNAEELAQHLGQSNIKTYVACNLRFHPAIKFLKSYLSAEKRIINEVNIKCGSNLADWRPGKDFRQIYSANKDMGGGVHLDLYHEMDYCCWLFGLPTSYSAVFSSKSTLEIDAVDYANYVLSFANFNVSVILNYYRSSPQRSVEILFDKETWVVDLLTNQITSDKGGVVYQNADFSILNTYVEQMRYFIDYISNREPSLNSFSESLNILKVSLNDESVKR